MDTLKISRHISICAESALGRELSPIDINININDIAKWEFILFNFLPRSLWPFSLFVAVAIVAACLVYSIFIIFEMPHRYGGMTMRWPRDPVA